MFETQEIIQIKLDELTNKAQSLMTEGYRLVQICCTKVAEELVIDYTFDKDYKFLGLRLQLPLENPELPSISKIYFAAFTYENELHDLFGIKINGLVLDFGGKFYRKEEEKPFITNAREK